MNKFAKSLFITAAINTICFLIGFATSGFFFIFIVLTVIEFFGGLLLLIDKSSRQVAAGIVTAAGITFIIGLSVCSTLNIGVG